MAKKKRAKRRPLRHDAAQEQHDPAKSYAPGSQYIDLPLSQTKQSVQKAHQKHKFDWLDRPTSPTLADQFHALPGELREHIFSFLLVRPVKWDLKHLDECQWRYDSTTSDNHRPWKTSPGPCAKDAHVRWWRSANRDEIEVAPWVSKWAPAQANPYVCTLCWESRLRQRPFPWPKNLPCLCARRPNLEVLLVCKRWYQEAGRVFYSRNTFAFESSNTFVRFFDTLAQQWRALISHVSIMAYYHPRSHLPDSNNKLRNMLAVFRTIPRLSTLELDALFLSRFVMVDGLRQLGLNNVRSVRFVLRKPPQKIVPYIVQSHAVPSENTFVWNELAPRVLIRHGLAEEVARALKGERRSWLRHKNELINMVDLTEKLFTGNAEEWDGQSVDGRSISWSNDPYERHSDHWSKLWWKYGTHATGFMPD